MKLYELANSKEWKPWELQSALRREFEGVIAVGDDLSFTIKLDFEIPNEDLNKIGGKSCSIYPFKNAYRFESGFIAFSGKFLRISRKIDKAILEKTLEALLK